MAGPHDHGNLEHNETSKEHPALVRLKELWDKGEWSKLERMLRREESFEALGTVGGMIKTFFYWAVGLLAALVLFGEQVKHFIQTWAGRP